MMSARAGRNKFFIGIIIFLLMFGFITIFRSSQQELDESRELRLRCEQQQEALNSRLQAIIEHKFKVEKALETERREHSESKQHCEQEIKEQKNIHNRATSELNTRFESLQQHYKLLQSEHNDLVEECMKTKEKQLEEINGIKGKIKSLQSQVQQTKNQHQKDIEEWKLKYNGLMQEKKRIENLLSAATSSNDYAVQRCKRTNENLEKLLTEYRSHCDYRPQQEEQHNENKNDNEKLNGHLISNSKDGGGDGGGVDGLGSGNPHEIDNQIAPNLLMNADEANINNNNNNNNPIENKLNGNGNNDNKQVLQQPPPLNSPIKSTSSNPLKTSSLSSSSLDQNRLNKPESLQHYASVAVHSTSEKIKRSSSTLANNRYKESGGRLLLKSKTIPNGVAPVPDNFDVLVKNYENNQSENNNNNNNNNSNNNNNNNNNNRYANVVDELSGKKDDTEQDNGAQEVKDDINIAGIDDSGKNNLNDIGGDGNNGKDHLEDILDNVNNNAAEEDTNNFVDSKGIINRQKHNNNNNNEDVEVIGGGAIRGGGGGGGGGGIGNNKMSKDKADSLLEGDDKLINEVVGDQGKEAAFPDGMHLEEEHDEDEDEDDYINPAARQQEGPAIRN